MGRRGGIRALMTFEILERTTLTRKTRLNPSSLSGNTRRHSFDCKAYGCKSWSNFFFCNNRTQRFRFILCTITFGLQINSGGKVIGVPNKEKHFAGKCAFARGTAPCRVPAERWRLSLVEKVVGRLHFLCQVEHRQSSWEMKSLPPRG